MDRQECVLCRGRMADDELERVEVWQDDLWRLTVSVTSEVLGFSYLEPKRHIKDVTELVGKEAATFGQVLATCTAALKKTTKADIVYIYIFGDGVPHFHVHLAPHFDGDALNDQMIKGEIEEEKLPNGMTKFISSEFPSLPTNRLISIADDVRELLKNGKADGPMKTYNNMPL